MNRNRNNSKRGARFANGAKPTSEKGKHATESKPSDDTKASSEPKPSYADKAKANSAITVSRGPSFAGMVKVHKANHVGECHNARIVPIEDIESPPPSINDWLIDSGATNHMTPYVTDFEGELIECDTAVEVANGGIIVVKHKGQVRIAMMDMDDSSKNRDIIVEDVLLVPGLKRRLFSVTHWNECNGSMTFLQDKTRIELNDDNGTQIFSVNVTPPFAEEHPDMTPPKGVHSANDISQTKKKHFVDAETLHNRLGHRSVSTVILAAEDKLWDDIDVRGDMHNTPSESL
jgi:hypothetical protein